jgi:exopolysaccharide biosynthesis polyprenyl glycosylphosphotransferase
MLVARRKLLREALALCDAVTLVASFAAAYVAVGFLFQRDFVSFAGYAWLLALILPIWLVCLRIFGFYSAAAYASARGLVGRLVRMQFIAGLVLLSLMYLTRSEAISRLLLQTLLAVSFLLLAAQKFALRAYLDNARRRTPTRRRKVLLVSMPAEAERYLGLIRAHASILADVVGMLTPGGSNGHVIEGPVPRILGAVQDLPAVLQAQVVDEVVVVSVLEHALLERLSRWCSMRGILMSMLVELPRPGLGVWHAEHFGEGAFLLSLATIPQNAIRLLIKRIVDVVGAAIGIVLCGVAYVWYGVRLRRETGDSVLFRQRRVGHNGRRFTLYKFRTMHPKAEQLKAGLAARNEMRGPIFKLSNDPRVTRTGRKLRRRHLDELPQFWNVLKGEMSLVGTRPPTEDETASYAEHHQRRLSMKPGLTGLWQLNGNGAVKDFEEVVKLDCEYIDNWSLWLDCKIVAKTVTKVMRGDGW